MRTIVFVASVITPIPSPIFCYSQNNSASIAASTCPASNARCILFNMTSGRYAFEIATDKLCNFSLVSFESFRESRSSRRATFQIGAIEAIIASTSLTRRSSLLLALRTRLRLRFPRFLISPTRPRLPFARSCQAPFYHRGLPFIPVAFGDLFCVIYLNLSLAVTRCGQLHGSLLRTRKKRLKMFRFPSLEFVDARSKEESSSQGIRLVSSDN